MQRQRGHAPPQLAELALRVQRSQRKPVQSTREYVFQSTLRDNRASRGAEAKCLIAGRRADRRVPALRDQRSLMPQVTHGSSINAGHHACTRRCDPVREVWRLPRLCTAAVLRRVFHRSKARNSASSPDYALVTALQSALWCCPTSHDSAISWQLPVAMLATQLPRRMLSTTARIVARHPSPLAALTLSLGCAVGDHRAFRLLPRKHRHQALTRYLRPLQLVGELLKNRQLQKCWSTHRPHSGVSVRQCSRVNTAHSFIWSV